MKALLTKSIFLFALFISVQSISASIYDSGPTVQDQLRNYLIGFPQDLVEDEVKVTVTFMLNKESKIVVVSTDNKELDKFVKNSLNYKTLKNHTMEENQVYFLPVILKKA